VAGSLLLAWGMIGCATADRSPAATSSPVSGASTNARLELTDAEEKKAIAMAHYATGVSREIAGQVDAAIESYYRAFELDPQHTALAIRLAKVYLSRRNFTQAQEVLQQATKATPQNHDLWFWLGVAYKADEKTDEAMAALRQANKLNPSAWEPIRGMLDIFVEKDNAAEAGKLLDRTFRTSSNDPMFWVTLGDVYGLTLKMKPGFAPHLPETRVRQCYEKALSLAPDDPEVVLRIADQYETAKDFKAAAEYYQKLLDTRPADSNLRMKLAHCHVQSGDNAAAAKQLEEIIKKDPLRFEVYNLVADLYEEMDQPDRAISLYQQSLVLNPHQLQPHLSIVLLQLRKKDFDAALKSLKPAKEKFPTAFQVPYFYGLIFSEQKSYERAVTAYADAETLAREAPNEVKLDSSFYFSFGAAHERSGEFDKAAAMFRKAIELDPNNHSAYNYLGYMWADNNINLEEAHQLIKKAVELEPNNGAYIDSLGWVLFRLGKSDEALVQIRRAAELIKDDATILDHLADVLLKSGKREDAISVLRRASELEPENKAISEKLERLSTPH
jgi:tetratricopeptide (TPR) repeat protein